MKKIIQSFLLVLALMVSGTTAYGANSFITANGDGTYTGTLYASITAQADSWIELDRGTGLAQFGRSTRPAGEFSVQVTGLACGRSYPYRLGAINPYTGANFYGDTFNLTVNCDTNTGGGNTGGNSNVTVTTGSASQATNSATLSGSTNTSADSWIETNTGNGTIQIGRGNRSGSYTGFISGLQCNTTYYYRAAAQGNNGIVYGDTRNFTTNTCGYVDNGNGNNNNNNVFVTTGSASQATNSATLSGSTNTSADSWIETNTGNGTIQIGRGNRSGSYTGFISGLQCNTTYYYRAAAQGNNGIVYGDTRNFTTNTCGYVDNGNGNNNNNNVFVTTGSASQATNSATLSGSTNTSADSWIETNTGNGTIQIGRGNRSGSYTGFISGLQCNTTYYYRAAAQGNNGIVYGDTRNFTTNTCGYVDNGNGNNTNGSIRTITTAATGVGFTSARLNGIAVINSTPTTSYFEYGTSASLGNRTQSKTYYESNSAPLVDILTGLSTNTTYYYRAVAQNANGISFGDIVSFRTEVFTNTSTNTNTNTNTTTNTNNTVRTNTNTNGIVYIPVQLASVGIIGTTTGTAVPALATVTVEKIGSDNCQNVFRVTYTNISDRALTNTLLNVSLPNELSFVSATDGSFRATDSTLTVPVGVLGARESRTVTITTTILSGAQLNKTVAVTGYLNYTEGISSAQNQVTGYTLLTINSQCDLGVIGSGAGAVGLTGILPNTLLQWLLAILAIVIIVIAGRSLVSKKA